MNNFLSVVVCVFSRLLRSGSLATLALTVVLFGITGCGGGGGGGSGANPGATPGGTVPIAPEPPSQPVPGVSSVTVSVTDALGQPAAGARVTLDWNSYRYANDDGILQFASVSPGPIYAYAWDVDAPVSAGGSTNGVLELNSHLDLAVTTTPWSELKVVGVANAQVATGGVSGDGRSLEFSLRLLLPDGIRYSLRVEPCAPDNGNDAPQFQADCVQGPPGFDAAYQAGNSGQPLQIIGLTAATPSPYSVAVLLDQGRDLVASDPNDARLYMLKYFLLHKPPESSVAVAAFGANDSASGAISTLPQQPITIFPIDDPQFTTAGTSLLSLAFSEGGVSPLLAALANIADFTETHTPSDRQRSVVVLADGQDTTCGNTSQCKTARQALIDQLQTSRIGLITVGTSEAWDFPNGRALSQLAAETDGIALWAFGSHVLADVFNQLPALLDGSAQFQLARFRLESPVDAVFSSGKTVHATIFVEQDTGYGSAFLKLPFEIRIPDTSLRTTE